MNRALMLEGRDSDQDYRTPNEVARPEDRPARTTVSVHQWCAIEIYRACPDLEGKDRCVGRLCFEKVPVANIIPYKRGPIYIGA